MKSLLTYITFVLLAKVSPISSCDPQQIAYCVQNHLPILGYMIENEGNTLSNDGDQQFVETCKVGKQFLDCTGASAAGCQPEDREILDNVTSTLQNKPFFCRWSTVERKVAAVANKGERTESDCNLENIDECTQQIFKEINNTTDRCRLGQKLVKCLSKKFAECDPVILQQVNQALYVFNRPPLNCDVRIVLEKLNKTRPVPTTVAAAVCDVKKVTECSKKVISYRLKETQQVCKLLQEYIDCIGVATTGCPPVLLSKIHQYIRAFQGPPHHCNISTKAIVLATTRRRITRIESTTPMYTTEETTIRCDAEAIQQCYTVFSPAIWELISKPVADRTPIFVENICSAVNIFFKCSVNKSFGCPPGYIKPSISFVSRFNKSPYNCSIYINGMDNLTATAAPFTMAPKRNDCDLNEIEICVKRHKEKLQHEIKLLDKNLSLCQLQAQFFTCLKRATSRCSSDLSRKFREMEKTYTRPPFNCSFDHVTATTPRVNDTRMNTTLNTFSKMNYTTATFRKMNYTKFMPPRMNYTMTLGNYTGITYQKMNHTRIMYRNYTLPRFNYKSKVYKAVNYTYQMTTPEVYKNLSQRLCNKKEVDKCNMDFKRNISFFVNNTFLKAKSSEFCPPFKKFMDCLRPWVSDCSEEDVTFMKQVLNEYSESAYVCLLSSDKCNLDDVKTCSRGMYIVMGHNPQKSSYSPRVCSFVRYYYNCLERKLLPCAPRRFYFIAQVLKRKFSGDYYRCDLTGGVRTTPSSGTSAAPPLMNGIDRCSMSVFESREDIGSEADMILSKPLVFQQLLAIPFCKKIRKVYDCVQNVTSAPQSDRIHSFLSTLKRYQTAPFLCELFHRHEPQPEETLIFLSGNKTDIETTSPPRIRNDVTCNEHSINVTIPIHSIPQPFSRHLINRRCIPSSIDQSKISIVFKLDECGTQVKIEKDNIVYINELREKNNIAKPIVIKCLYKIEHDGLASGFRTYDKNREILQVGKGSIRVVLEQFKDSTYSDVIEDPNAIPRPIDSRVYFRVTVKNSESFIATAERCSVSRKQLSNVSNAHDMKELIKNGCSMDKEVKIENRSRSEGLKFSVPANLLGTDGNAVVKCVAKVCPVGQNCFPPCTRRRKRNVRRGSIIVSSKDFN